MEGERYPISVRLVGVMHKEKKKMYMASVLWSDQNDIVVYRTFRDFQKLHKQMKKVFSASSKLKKSERIIPKFQYKRVKRRGQRKSTTRSLVVLKFLQKYCNELLSCDSRVCQCSDLVQFFHPNEQDFKPEFSKNSIMVMPTDDELRANFGQSDGGNVTQPFVTETYRCVAAYDTKDTKNKPFKVAPDEKLDVLIKDKAGWWLVENDKKRMAWFPAPYLEKLEEDSDGDDNEIDGAAAKGMLYTAIKSYKAAKTDEITVNIGAVVEVLQKPDNGWWLIRYNDRTGFIPTIYLQPYNYPHIRLMPTLQDHPSTPQLQIPSSLGHQSHQFSRSQSNLQEMPSSRPSSPYLLQPESKQKSRSLNMLPLPSPKPLTSVVATVNMDYPLYSVHRRPPPKITIEIDDQDHQGRSFEEYSLGSFDSESDSSFRDDHRCSSGSSSINLNVTEDCTPPPCSSNYLSPATGPGARMMPSVSDPNLYKGPTLPKVPPRPQAKEILKRCTTITRKNAAKGSESTQLQMPSL